MTQMQKNSMKTDGTTKALLTLIALALVLNEVVPFVQPALVQAQDSSIEGHLRKMSNVVMQISNEFKRISDGSCFNDRIC